MAIIICVIIAAAGGVAAAAWPHSHHPAALPRPSCGSAQTHFLTGHTQFLAADPGALSCFVRAAKECRSASLGVTEMGVDTGTNYVFTIKPGTAPCQVTEDSRAYSANFGGSQGPLSTVRCHRTAVTRAGVMLSCRGRDVLIPARVSTAPKPG
jgi:hypothetical protein